jgi:hypothetical protein
MESGFGGRLRLQREQQGVTIRTIADRTKIKISLLEGLERDDLSQWPAGIFRRSYFRDYVQAIGLDAETYVREFLERYPDPNDESGPFPGDARGSGPTSAKPPMRLRYLIDSAVGVLPARRAPGMAERAHNSILEPPSFSFVPDVTLRGDPVAEGAVGPVEPPGPSLAEPPAPDIEPLALTFMDSSPEPAAPIEPLSVQPPEHASLAAAPAQAPPDAMRVDFTAVAHLCTRLARVMEARELTPAIEDAATMLDAVGVILWIWNPRWRALSAALAHGYPDELLRQLSRVPDDGETAIAAAFRSAETLVVNGTDAATGAIVVPLMPPSGCAGVLALELPSGVEQRADVRAAATILAAQLAMLVGSPALARAVNA